MNACQISHEIVHHEEEIHWYLEDLAAIPPLPFKEEQEVIQQIAAAPDSLEAEAARKRLIEAHLRLVVRLARRYQPFGVELADLVQEGNLTLTTAAHAFNPRQKSFKAFATRRISRTLYRMVATHIRENHLVEHSMELSIHPLRTQLLKALAHNAIDEQVLVFDLPEERLFSLTALLDEADTDFAIPDDRSSSHTACYDEITPEAHYLAQERSTIIAACLHQLTMKERLVLTHRYLLGIAQTLEEVGRILGISRERVRQIEERGIRKMRHPRHVRILRSLL